MTRTTYDLGLYGIGSIGPGGARLWIWPVRRRLAWMVGRLCMAVVAAWLAVVLAVLMFCM